MDWALLNEVATGQHGVLGVADVERTGSNWGTLLRHAKRYGWLHPAAGVVVLPGVRPTFEQRTMVAVRAAGREALASRATAAYLWGIRDRPPERIEVVVPYGNGPLPLDGVQRWRSRTLTAQDVAVARGVPVTSPPRTVVDLAPVLSQDLLRFTLVDAHLRRIVRPADVAEVYRRQRRTPGGPRLLEALLDVDESQCDSRLDVAVRRLLARGGLEPYPNPFPYRCSDGVLVHIDVAFPGHWVAIEVDGFGSRSQRAVLEQERVRRNALVRDGWRPYPIDWLHLSRDPEAVLRDVAAMLAVPLHRPPALPAHTALM